MTELGDVVRLARKQHGWTLRRLEKETGIRNAHLSQIENGTIARPSFDILWKLHETLSLDYEQLLVLAGHAGPDAGEPRRSLDGAALRAWRRLRPDQEPAALRYLESLSPGHAEPDATEGGATDPEAR